MGHIKEPDGIDFVVDSKPLTHAEREQISQIIAPYKATGRKTKLPITIGRKKPELPTPVLQKTDQLVIFINIPGSRKKIPAIKHLTK